ncbi:MAG: MBL fold metallo-hydrolase [Gemmatimonadetes bacterium]|nr:MBL fold metallo-hydrolase [Gemmatimonadota bacterium]
MKNEAAGGCGPERPRPIRSHTSDPWRIGLALVAAVASAVATPVSAQEADAAVADASASHARLVILGTGTPNADPDRSGPAVAVVVGGQAYLVDAGAGIVRRAAAASARHGIDALAPSGLDRLFLTHLHSDHTVGLPDVIFSPWVLERPDPIVIFGPPGTAYMVDHVQEAWKEDVHMRLFGLEPHDYNRDAFRSPVTETRGGPVYEDEHVRVTAIPVMHGSWPHSLGYRFDALGPDGAAGRTIVISGDARPSESLVEACDGCDILVHEVYSAETFKGRPPEWQRYHADSHTSTVELADIATRARPGLLVMYHQLYWGATDEDLVREVREAGYTGRVVSAADLDVY